MKPPAPREPGSWIPDVFVRQALPISPERLFDVLTGAEGLTLWLCDRAVSDARAGGKVVATWVDPKPPHETVTRQGTWLELERPQMASLGWDQPSEDAHPDHPEVLKFAIAESEGGCTVTVLSPCPQQFEHTTPTTVQDATRRSWQQLLQELADALSLDPDRSPKGT